jgi:hypothetical protein
VHCVDTVTSGELSETGCCHHLDDVVMLGKPAPKEDPANMDVIRDVTGRQFADEYLDMVLRDLRSHRRDSRIVRAHP